jgi:hypothetical protein
MHAQTKLLPPSSYGPHPDLQPAPPSLLSALEEYINQISDEAEHIPVSGQPDYNRDVGAFAGLSGLSSLGGQRSPAACPSSRQPHSWWGSGGSFALSAKQLDQVLLKIEKLERSVQAGLPPRCAHRAPPPPPDLQRRPTPRMAVAQSSSPRPGAIRKSVKRRW